MRVQFVKESSGFGYRSKIATWLAESDENLGKLQKLQKGNVVEIPNHIAGSIHNLVNVETGEVISGRSEIHISKDEIKKRYLKAGLETSAKVRKSFDEVKPVKTTLEIKKVETVKGEDKIKPLNEENK